MALRRDARANSSALNFIPSPPLPLPGPEPILYEIERELGDSPNGGCIGLHGRGGGGGRGRGGVGRLQIF